MRNNCQDKYEDHNHLKDPELSNTMTLHQQ